MPAQSTISLTDGQSTPATHVFAPKGARMQNGKNVASWRDGTQPSMLAKWVVEETHTPAVGNSPEKFRYVLRIPSIVTDVNGVVTSPRFTLAEVQVFLPLAATPGEVNDIHALTKAFVSSAYFQSAIRDREAAW